MDSDVVVFMIIAALCWLRKLLSSLSVISGMSGWNNIYWKPLVPTLLKAVYMFLCRTVQFVPWPLVIATLFGNDRDCRVDAPILLKAI